MSEPRKASEVEDEGFPYGWPKKVCYFHLDEQGVPQFAYGRDEMRVMVKMALAGLTTLYAVWPGAWRSDLFVVDDVEVLAKVLGVSLEGSPRPSESVAMDSGFRRHQTMGEV